MRGVWARNSNFLGFHCRMSEKNFGEINLFHLENIYLCIQSCPAGFIALSILLGLTFNAISERFPIVLLPLNISITFIDYQQWLILRRGKLLTYYLVFICCAQR